MAMAKLTEGQVLHIAKLARLPLSSDEINQFTKEMEKILSFVNEINRVKAGKFELGSTINGLYNILREDKIDVSSRLNPDQALKNAPSTQNQFFKVKAVLES